MTKHKIRISAFLYCFLIFSFFLINSQPCRASGTTLEQAIKGNDFQSLKQIIDGPRNPQQNAFFSNFNYYLKRAARFGSAPLLNYVLSKAPSSNIKNVVSEALVVSIDNDNFHEVVPVLLKAGARPNHEYNFMTALCRLAYLYADDKKINSKALNTMKLLLDKGAYVNTFGQDGKTPLMHACQSNNLEMAKLLIKYDADPNMQNKEAQTAFDFLKKGSSLKNVLNRKSTIAG